MDIIVYKSKKYLDSAGQRVEFDKPYYDKALRRQFNSVEEKAGYMKSRNLAQNGDSEEKARKQYKAEVEKNLDSKSRMI